MRPVRRRELLMSIPAFVSGTRTANAQKNGAVEKLFEFEADSNIVQSPTVVNGTVYIGSYDTLYAVDAKTGDKYWEAEYDGSHGYSRENSAPCVVDGTVYSGYRNLHAFDAESGTREWTFDGVAVEDNLGEFQGSPLVEGGTVYIGSAQGSFHALDSGTGEERWRFDGPDAPVFSSPTVAGGNVYFTSDKGVLYSLDKDTGEERWRHRGVDTDGFLRNIGASCDSSPTVADGTVYFAAERHDYPGLAGTTDTDSVLLAVNASTGERVWRHRISPSGVSSSPTFFEGTVYIADEGGYVYAVDGKTGDEIWQAGRDVYPPYKYIVSSPTYADGFVLVGSSREGLHFIEAETGEPMPDLRFEGGVESSPTVVDGIVYFGDFSDSLYALDASNYIDGSSEGSRASLGTLGHHHSWTGEDRIELREPSVGKRLELLLRNLLGTLLNPAYIIILILVGYFAYRFRPRSEEDENEE